MMSRGDFFRGKQRTGKGWVEGYYVVKKNLFGREEHKIHQDCSGKDKPINYEYTDILPETLSRHLRNGNLSVWENEVYSWKSEWGICTGIVKYGNYIQDGSVGEYRGAKCYGFYIDVIRVCPLECTDLTQKEVEEFYPDYLKNVSIYYVFDECHDVKLLGNIFDDPELLRDHSWCDRENYGFATEPNG